MLFRRKLDSSETAGHTFGQSKSQRGFAHTRNILQKYMASGKESGQKIFHYRLFPNENLIDILH